MPSIKEVIQKLVADRSREEETQKKAEEEAFAQREELSRQTLENCLTMLRKSGARKIFEDLNQEVLGGQGKIWEKSGVRILRSDEEYRVSSVKVCHAYLFLLWDRAGKEQGIVVEALVYTEGNHPILYVADDLERDDYRLWSKASPGDDFVLIEDNSKIEESTQEAVARVFLTLPH